VPARLTHISRRERQILDVLFRLGRATVTEVRDRLPDPPSYSAVRALLRILEQKGHVRHLQDGPRYVFMPTVRRDSAKRSALRHLVNTFFEDRRPPCWRACSRCPRAISRTTSSRS
jgi:predicted transcriptional regulator